MNGIRWSQEKMTHGLLMERFAKYSKFYSIDSFLFFAKRRKLA